MQPIARCLPSGEYLREVGDSTLKTMVLSSRLRHSMTSCPEDMATMPPDDQSIML